MIIPAFTQYSSVRRRLLQVPLFLLDVLGVNRLLRLLTARHVRVLMYHGVSDEPLGPDYWLLLSRSAFEWQMSYLNGKFEVCPWTCLLDQPTEGSRPSRPRVVITFDDGYANLCRNASPALARFSYPSVCFVIPDLSDRGEELWTTKLFRLLLESNLSELSVNGAEGGHLNLPQDRAKRKVAVSRFVSSLKSKSPSEIKNILDHVTRACESTDRASVAREFALMSMDDILKIRDAADVTLGTHSNSHYSLSSLGPAEQEAQIVDSMACLNGHGIEPTAVFAYPSGHFDSETISILRKHGFKVAFTTEEGLFHPGDDLMTVKRVAIGSDITRLEFKARVSGADHFVYWLLGRRA